MKDNLKIFKILFFDKFFRYFLSQFYQQIKGCVFFFNSCSKFGFDKNVPAMLDFGDVVWGVLVKTWL